MIPANLLYAKQLRWLDLSLSSSTRARPKVAFLASITNLSLFMMCYAPVPFFRRSSGQQRGLNPRSFCHEATVFTVLPPQLPSLINFTFKFWRDPLKLLFYDLHRVCFYLEMKNEAIKSFLVSVDVLSTTVAICRTGFCTKVAAPSIARNSDPFVKIVKLVVITSRQFNDGVDKRLCRRRRRRR